ncbi:DUF6221 family protein [Streptomyces sp. NBC_00442]|uniref:DUF6221 family protein n=1 Tax=Streptomyces sp. NBC_00442 TaxID=2903651 RepID=UPI002E20A39D
MDDLVQFLRDRYDDAESAALGAKGETSGRWTQDDGPPEDIMLYDKSGKLTVGQARHIARHDPARVLAEIEAKRQILRDLEQAEFSLSKAEAGTVPHDLMTGAVNTLRRTVRLLAQPYSDHPDYREGWRP